MQKEVLPSHKLQDHGYGQGLTEAESENGIPCLGASNFGAQTK